VPASHNQSHSHSLDLQYLFVLEDFLHAFFPSLLRIENGASSQVRGDDNRRGQHGVGRELRGVLYMYKQENANSPSMHVSSGSSNVMHALRFTMYR
jgi:hypothetical protein